MRRSFFFCLIFLCGACDESPLITKAITPELNNPGSMALVPGTKFAVVVNENIYLSQKGGSLIAVDLDQKKVLKNTFLPLPSFAGQIAVDGSSKRIFISDRSNDAILVYQYKIPGSSGKPISFSEVKVPNSVPDIGNGIPTDDNPFDIFLWPIGGTRKLFVTNSVSGTVSILSATDFSFKDLNPRDDRLNGLPLISAANFSQQDQKPGTGASRIAPSPDGKLLFVGSTTNNQIYVVDAADKSIEAMIDLTSLTSVPGTHGLTIAKNNLAYLTHRGLNGVLVLDVNNVTDNGIDYEVVDPTVIDLFVAGEGPENVLLSQDEKRLFVSNENSNTVSIFDLNSNTLSSTFNVGRSPATMVADPARAVFYVLNFLSDSITVVNEASGKVVDTIR